MAEDLVDETVEAAPRTYEIHADRLEELAARVDKANRRLARAKAADQFTFSFEPFVLEGVDEFGEPVHVPMLRVVLSAPRIKAGGYTFVASLTREPGGMVVRTAPGQSLDGWERPEEHGCDYCGKSRGRNTSYVVRNDVTGEVMQIGKSCLVPFLGISPAGLWTLELDPDDLLPEGDDREYFGGHVPRLYPIRELLALAWVVSEDGQRFVSARQAREWEKPSTAGTTLFVWNWRPVGSGAEKQRPYVEEMRRAARDVPGSVLDELLEAAGALDPETDYGANMAAALSADMISASSARLVVSLIAVRNRLVRDRIAAADRAAIVDAWLGNVGDKLENLDVTVRVAMRVDGYAYNSTDTIVVMRTGCGHALKWKASGVRPDIEEGGAYQLVRATVKDHGEYRGSKQTVVTRCKLVPADSSETT